MKTNRLMNAMIVLAALPASTVLAQSLTGSWQGTLQAGRELRVVLKVATTGQDSLKATFYSIDQQAPALPGTIALQGSTVKVAIPGIGGSYEGKLSSDGNSIAGTWTQGPKPLPLNLTRATTETAWAIPEPPAPVKPMSKDANPVFEVATIKPSKPGQPGKGFTVRGRRFLTINTSVSDLITFSYDLHARQVAGGAAWLESDKLDITGEPDGQGQPSLAQWKIMIQKLLADRFKLTFHREQKELPVYAIVVGKNGPKLTNSEGDPNGLPGLAFRGLGNLPVRNAKISDFAGVMQAAVLDRPVVDHTGLPGRYDFTLTWTPDSSQFAGMGITVPTPAADDSTAPPDLFTAMVQQLGLRMESTKAPVDVLVIDRVEKPSEN